jgi:Flp pilus assembly protein TadG
MARCDSGAVAVEFAIIGPVLLVMLLGIAAYGGYFWVAHAVQQVANDAARVAIGGLDEAERAQLAQGVIVQQIGDYAYLTANAAEVTLDDADQTLTVNVAYDASHTPFWSLGGLVPMPSSTIVRTATIRVGGY